MAILNTLLTNGVNLDPIDSLGGIMELWINPSMGMSFSFTTTATASAIISLTASPISTWFQFDIPKDTAVFTETLTSAPAAGTLFYQQDLTIVVPKMSVYTRNQLNLLSRNRFIRAVFRDNNNRWWITGLQRGGQITGGSITTGTNPGDANGYTYTLQAQEAQPVFSISAANGLGSGTSSWSGFTWSAAVVQTTP